jgi:hypothetical protein
LTPQLYAQSRLMAVCLAHHCGRLEELPVKPSKTLSIDPILNTDPPGVHIELLCSLCGETDGLMLSLTNPVICRSYGDTTFILFCGRHCYLGSN